MGMRQTPQGHAGMVMVVMSVIVTMAVFVCHRFMSVQVGMSFSQQERHRKDHQHQRTAEQQRRCVLKQDK